MLQLAQPDPSDVPEPVHALAAAILTYYSGAWDYLAADEEQLLGVLLVTTGEDRKALAYSLALSFAGTGLSDGPLWRAYARAEATWGISRFALAGGALLVVGGILGFLAGRRRR